MFTAIRNYFKTKKATKALDIQLDKTRAEFKAALKTEEERLMRESLKYQHLNYQTR